MGAHVRPERAPDPTGSATHWHHASVPGIVYVSSSILHAVDAKPGAITLEGLIDEFARALHEPEIARVLVLRAHFPPADLPAFDVPRVFWSRVIRAAAAGKVIGGVQALVAEAAKQYPGNDVFAGYPAHTAVVSEGGNLAERLEPATPSPTVPSSSPSVISGRIRATDSLTNGEISQEPSPLDSVAAKLHAAYSRRRELLIAGEDTAHIDAAILGLRRELRRGPTLQAGELLGDGRFLLKEVIGRGGFATVWKAYDEEDRAFVAVKVLHGQFVDVPSRRERLFRGAKRMARLQHPNVVRVLIPKAEDQGFYYYVMEYIDGGDLHQAILEKRLGTDQAFDVIELIAAALGEAHRQGLVHRDVKPQNILLRKDGTPALTDFDLVQARDTTGGTHTGALGTIVYAAPEQNTDAKRVDYRTDIFSLGMAAIFCIYGNDLPVEVMYRRDTFLANLSCSTDIRAVLHKAVAIERNERYETMASFRTALANARLVAPEEVALFSRPGEPAHHIHALRAVQDQIRKGERRLVVHMAPLTGKTNMAIKICDWLLTSGKARSILFLTTTRMLTEQIVRRMRGDSASGSPAFTFPVRHWTSDQNNFGVTVAITTQMRKISTPYDAILVDDVTTFSAFPPKWLASKDSLLIGFSSIEGPVYSKRSFGRVAYSFSVENAIEAGLLLPMRTMRITLPSEGRPEDREDVEAICTDLVRRLDLDRGKVFIYCSRVDRARRISSLLQAQLVHSYPGIITELAISISSREADNYAQIHDFIHSKTPLVIVGGGKLISICVTPQIGTVVIIDRVDSEELRCKLFTLGALPNPSMGKTEALVLEYGGASGD